MHESPACRRQVSRAAAARGWTLCCWPMRRASAPAPCVTLLIALLAVLGLPLWLVAALPGDSRPQLRVLAATGWALAAGALLVALVREHWLTRVRSRRVEALGRCRRVDAAGANACNQCARRAAARTASAATPGPCAASVRSGAEKRPGRAAGDNRSRQPEHGEQRNQRRTRPQALARGVREQNRVQPRAAAEAVGRERDGGRSH